jgi:quercetin dioxygenase-like cupin family protein
MSSDEVIGKVIPALDLISYQKAAIVSRTFVDRDQGTITLFAFDTDQGLSEHTVPYDALVYLLEGQAIVTISGEDMILQQGDLVIMPANEPHAVKAVTRFKMMLVMIRYAYA